VLFDSVLYRVGTVAHLAEVPIGLLIISVPT